MQYAGPANSSGTTTLPMHFGHGDVTNSQALQPTANAASTTSILRNYRKKDGGGGAAGGEKAQSAEAPPAGEIQGPVARVAPHAHYPKPSGGDGSFRYHQHYADFGMQPAQVVAPPVKYSEIIEPVQTLEHHLARGAVPKPKEKGYFEMACGQAYAKGSYEYNFGSRVINGAYKQQFPANPGGPHHLYHPQHHGYFTGADKNHQQQYLQKDVGASGPNGAVPGPNPPGYGMNYNKMHQYQGRYGASSRDGNDFLSNLNKIAPDIAQDILNDQHLREQQFPPVYLPDQNRLYTQQRTYQRASNAAAAFGQRNLGYNQYHHQLNQRNFQDNYRFYQNAANLRLPQFEQQPPSDASPRYETQHHPFQNRLGPTFNHCATQLDYQQPYAPRNLHFRQDFPPPMHPKNFFESNPDIPEIVPEDVVSGRGGAAPGKSLKSYLESWNEEAFPDDDADAPPPKEGTLYVLETMEIPSENVPQYIHLQPIEKLPPNVRTLYPENETGANSACKLLQNIAINSQLRQDLGERHPAVSRSLPVLLREEGDDDERPNREDGDLEAKKPSETQCAYDRDKNNEGEDLSTKQPAKTFDAKVLEKIDCLFVEHGSLSNEKNPNTVNEIETLSKNDANNPENNDSVTETVVETRQPQTDSTSEDENNVATEFSPTTEESDEHDQKKPYKHFRITDPIRKNQTHPSNSPSNKVFEITSKYFEGSAFDSSPILCLGDDFDHHMCERDRDDEPVPLTFEHSEKRRERAAPEDDGPTSRHTENNTAASPPNLKLALSEDGGTEETVSKLEDPSAATDHDVEDLKKSESPIETGSDSESNRETDCSGDDSDIEQDRTENDDQRKINDGIEGEGSSGSSEESDDCSVKTTNVAITKVNENEHTNETHRHLSRSPGCESEHEQRKEIFHETENVVFDSQTIGNVKEQLREESKSNSNRKRKKSSHSFQDDTHEVYESCLLSTENKILIRKTGNSGKKEDDRVRNKSRRTESWGQNRNIFENKSDLEESSTSLPTKDIVKLNEKQNNELDDGGNEQKIDEDFSPVKSPRPLTAEVGINTENENSLYTKEVVQPNPTHVDNSTNTDINIRHKGEFIKTVDDQKKTNADDEFEESEIADAASFSETLASQTTMKITENFDKAEQNPCESENSSSESESEIKDVASFSETSRKSDEPEVAKQNLCESENTLYSSVLTAALTRSPFVECTNNIEVNNQNFNRSEPDDVKSIPEEQLPSDCARENLASSSINRVEVHNEIESTKNPEDSPKKESIEEEEETSINSPTSTSTTEEEDNDKITPDKETPSNSVLSIETQINDRIIESADEIPAIENPATNAEDYKSIVDEKLSSYGNSISSLDDDTDGSEADLSKAETGGEVVIDRNDSASSENIPLLVESTDEVDFYRSELTEIVIEEKDARCVTHEEAEKEKSGGTKTAEDVSVIENEITKNTDVRDEDELPPDDCAETQKENTIRPRKKRQAAKNKLTKIIRQLTERGHDKVTRNRDVAEDGKSDDNVQIVTSSREQNNNYETVEEIKSDKAGEEDLSISENTVEVMSFDGEETRLYAEETETSRLKRNINEPGDVPKIKERDVDEEDDVVESETLSEGLTETVGDDLEIAYTEEIIKDLKVTPSDKEEFERPKEEDGNSSEAIELTEEIITTETVQENEIIQEENVSVSVEEKKTEESIDESVILQISKELIQINVTTNDKGEKVISVTPLTKVKIVTSDESQLTFNVDETDGTDDAFLEEQLSGTSSELFTGSEEATPSEGTSPNKETPTEEDGEKVEQVCNLSNDDENPPELIPENRDVRPTETVSKDSKDVAAERDETMPILEPMITQDNAEDDNEVTQEQNDTEVENDVPKIKEIEPTITKASKVKKSVNEIEAVPKNCCGTRRPIFRKGDGEVRVRVPKKRLGANIKRTLTIENEAVPTRTTANETRDVNEEPTTMTTAKTFTTTRGKMSNYKIPKKKSNSKNETDPSKSRKFRRIRTFDSRDRKKRGEIKVVNEEENVTKENTIDKEERIQSKENKEKTKSTVESTEGTIEVTSIEVETTKSKEEDGKNSKKRVQFSLEGEVPKRSDDRKSPGRLMKSCLKPTGPAKKQYLDPSKRSFSSRVDEPVIIGDKKRRLSLEEYNIRKKRHVGSEKIEERQYYCFNGERLDGMDFESAKMQEEIEEEVLKNLSSPGGEETAPELEAIRSERATPTRHFVSNFDSDEDDGRDDREASERLEKSVTFVDKSVVEEKINSLEEFLPKIAKASSRRNTTEEISQKIDDLFAERPIYEQRNYDHFLISRFLNGGSLSSDELTKLREIVLKRRRNESKTVNIDFNDFDLRQSHGGEKISPRGKPEPEIALRTKAELKLFEDATETNPNTMFDNPRKELPSNISLYDEDEAQEIVKAKPFVVYEENPVNDCKTFEREDEPSSLKSYRNIEINELMGQCKDGSLDREVLSEGEANIEKTDDNSDPEEKSELVNEENRLINKPDFIQGQKVLEETRNLHKAKGAEIKRNKLEAQDNLEGYKELDETKSFTNLHKTKGAEVKKNKSEDKNNSEGYKELDEIKTFTNSHKTKGTEVRKSKPEGQNNNLEGYKVLDETKTSMNLHKTESAEVYDKRNCKENNGAEDKLTKRRRKRTYTKDEEKDKVFKVYDKKNCKEDESEDALAQRRHKRTYTKDEEERKINPDILEGYEEKNESGNLQEHRENRTETFSRKSCVGSEQTESCTLEKTSNRKSSFVNSEENELFRNEQKKINTNISTNEIVGSLSKNNDQEKNETRNLQEKPSTMPQDVLHKGRRTETFNRKSSVSSDKNESSPNKTGNFQESTKKIRTEASDRKPSCVNSKENLSSQNKTYTEDKTVNFREIASERSNRICQETSDKKPSYVTLKESESFQNKTHKKDKTGNIEEFPSESSSRIQKETSDKKPSYTNLKKNLSSQNETCKEDKTGNLQEFTSETSSGVCKETNPTQLPYKEDKTGNLQEFTSESSSRIRKETSDKKSSYVISSISESVQNKVSKEDETRNLQEFTSESFDRKPCCISLEKNKLSQNETYKEDKTGNFKEFTSESSSRIRIKPFNKKPSCVDSVENLSLLNEASKEDKTGNIKEFASESSNKIRTETFNKKPSVENLSFQNETSKEDKTGRVKTFDNSKEEEPQSKSHLEISSGTYETFDEQNHGENKQEDEYETKEKKRKITFTEEVTLTISVENVSNNCERQDNLKHYRSSSESEIHEIETSYFTEVQSTEAEGTSPKDDHVTVTNKNVEEQPIVPTQEQPKKCEREKLAKMNALIQIYKRALENPNATDKVRQIEALIDKVTGGNLRQIRKAIAPTTKPTPRAEYEVSPNRDEMKLHLKKVAGGRRRRKRFRNLYADDSEDEPKFDGYSIVRERSDERAPKLVIKLKKNHGRPYVRLSRLPVLEDMVRKRKRTVFLA